MTRCKSWTAILALLIVATALSTAVIAPKADASALKGRLRHAKTELRHARQRLTAAEAAVAATLSVTASGATTDPTTTTTPAAPASPTLAELQAKVDKERHAVRRWKRRVRRLARRVHLRQQFVTWESHGEWKPIIRLAAAKYHVKADGMYRMMMRESGGRRNAGSNTAFKGLYQYWTGTWAASWNPYRHDSIYDGSSQIYATAYAIHRGMGAQMWTTTWASQY